MKKKLKLDPNVVAAMKRNQFEKQLELRRLLHKACDIADRGEALLTFDPKAMTETQWNKMASLAKKIWDISSQCDGAIELKRMFGRGLETDTMKKNLEKLIS